MFHLLTAYNESSCTLEHVAVNKQNNKFTLMGLNLLQCTSETGLLLKDRLNLIVADFRYVECLTWRDVKLKTRQMSVLSCFLVDDFLD